MKGLYVPGSILWQRFIRPEDYLTLRLQVEQQLYEEFRRKGGSPKQEHPIYFVVGRPRWTIQAVDSATMERTAEIQVPLSVLDVQDVSFTYPDSMFAAEVARGRDTPYPRPDWYGQLLTLDETEELIQKEGLPTQGWRPNRSPLMSHYIEAQVWNQAVLDEYLRTKGWESLSASDRKD